MGVQVTPAMIEKYIFQRWHNLLRELAKGSECTDECDHLAPKLEAGTIGELGAALGLVGRAQAEPKVNTLTVKTGEPSKVWAACSLALQGW